MARRCPAIRWSSRRRVTSRREPSSHLVSAPSWISSDRTFVSLAGGYQWGFQSRTDTAHFMMDGMPVVTMTKTDVSVLVLPRRARRGRALLALRPGGEATTSFRRRLLQAALVAGALWYLGAYLVVALARINYPYDLEWMEGGTLEHVARVLGGQPLYVAPSLEFTPYIYAPLYYYVAAPFAYLFGLRLAVAANRFVRGLAGRARADRGAGPRAHAQPAGRADRGRPLRGALRSNGRVLRSGAGRLAGALLHAPRCVVAARERAARRRGRPVARGRVLHEAEHAAHGGADRPGAGLEPARAAAPAVPRGLRRGGGGRQPAARPAHARLVDLLPVHAARVPSLGAGRVVPVLARRSVQGRARRDAGADVW